MTRCEELDAILEDPDSTAEEKLSAYLEKRKNC